MRVGGHLRNPHFIRSSGFRAAGIAGASKAGQNGDSAPLIDMSESTITPAPSLEFPDGPDAGCRIGRGGRFLLAVWSLLLMAGFALAWHLEPDPRGYGTHQGLGLPPCSFQILFGINCPSCGGTTCFAHFVRGEWIAAARANVAAFGLALVCAAMIPWSWYSALRGRLWRIEDPATACLWLLLVLCGLSLVQWSIRLNWT